MSSKKPNNNGTDGPDVIDELFKKHKLLDDEGYLVGTDDPNLIAVFERIDQLSKKETLTNTEIEEGEELMEVQKAYTKEAQQYLLYERMMLGESDEEDSTFEDEDSSCSGCDKSHHDEYSYDSGSCVTTSDEYSDEYDDSDE